MIHFYIALEFTLVVSNITLYLLTNRILTNVSTRVVIIISNNLHVIIQYGIIAVCSKLLVPKIFVV